MARNDRVQGARLWLPGLVTFCRVLGNECKVHDLELRIWGKWSGYRFQSVWCTAQGSGSGFCACGVSLQVIDLHDSWFGVQGRRSNPQQTRCANIAHIRQSRPDSGLDFHVKGIQTNKAFPLRSESAPSDRLRACAPVGYSMSSGLCLSKRSARCGDRKIFRVEGFSSRCRGESGFEGLGCPFQW